MAFLASVLWLSLMTCLTLATSARLADFYHTWGVMCRKKKRAKLSRDRIASISNISVGISDLLKPHANSGRSELPSCPALEYIRATLYMGIFNLLDSLLHLSIYVSPPPLLCLSLPLGRKCHFIIKTSLLKFHHVSFFFSSSSWLRKDGDEWNV